MNVSNINIDVRNINMNVSNISINIWIIDADIRHIEPDIGYPGEKVGFACNAIAGKIIRTNNYIPCVLNLSDDTNSMCLELLPYCNETLHESI